MIYIDCHSAYYEKLLQVILRVNVLDCFVFGWICYPGILIHAVYIPLDQMFRRIYFSEITLQDMER